MKIKQLVIIMLAMFIGGKVRSQTSLPLMERIFGPTTANAACGNTGLTAAVSKYGEVVNLKWPLPNYYDHLNYKGLYPVPFGWSIENYNRYYNAQPLQGSFVGIEYQNDKMRKTTWLRDPEWTHKQYYLTDETPIIVTEYENTSLHMKVKSIDFIPSGNHDAFLRKFVFNWTNASSIKSAKIIFSSNMAPCNKNPSFDPNQDWVNDVGNGFANAWHSESKYFVSFIPNPAVAHTWLIPSIFSSQAAINRFVDNVDAIFPSLTSTYDPSSLLSVKDVYCIIGADRAPAAHGMTSDFGFPQAMPKSIIPNGQSISAHAAQLYTFYDLDLTNNTDSIVFQFAFGPTHSLARQTYESTYAVGFANLLERTKQYWQGRLAKATLPQTGDEEMQTVLKRILVNTLIGINRGSGAIGSSVCASQPAYSQLWVRDNAIMSYMLDCAGYTEEAEVAARFFANIQRKRAGEDCQFPANNECYAGTWSQCYYADGRPSWMYDFEIDEVGWGIWLLYEHANFLSGNERKQYLEYVYPAIKRGANFLRDFKDERTGLQLPAREDDVLWVAQTVYGASTTLMGLKAAASAGISVDDTATVVASWRTRIGELETAIQTHKWGLQGDQYDYTVYGNFGPRAMTIWPTLLRDTLDQQILSHANSLNNQITPFFSRSNVSLNAEWWYPGKTTAALAYLWRSDLAKRPVIENYLKILLKEVPTDGTYSYGETFMVRDVTIGSTLTRDYDNRVGQPSNHPAAWIYMTAEMLYGASHAVLYPELDDVVTSTGGGTAPSGFSIFPNPATGELTLQMTSEGKYECSIVNKHGETILKTTFNGIAHSLSLTGVPKGLYFVVVSDGANSLTQKLVIR